MKKALSLLGMIVALATAPTAGASSDPLELSFAKCGGPGVWTGTVGGDASGSLTTVLKAARLSDGVLHVNFDWIVSAGSRSFTANLDGILNTHTGRVVMNGTIVDGYLEGARVHEEGAHVGGGCFAGSIRVMPATAG